MKNNFLHTFFSILLSISIALPYALQMLHALEKHENTICTAKKGHHYHEQSADCSIYHQIIEHHTIDFSTEFELKTPLFFNNTPTCFYQSMYSIYLNFQSSRAPPYLLFTTKK